MSFFRYALEIKRKRHQKEEPMRKDDITRLVAIQGFSVSKIEFGREAMQVERREKEEKFYHKKKHRAKVMRKVPKGDVLDPKG